MKGKTRGRFLFSRTVVTIILVLTELIWLFFLVRWLHPYVWWLESVLRIASIFLVLWIITFSRHLSSDLMWVIIIQLFPTAGTVVYLFLNHLNHRNSKTYGKIIDETARAQKFFVQDPAILAEVKEKQPWWAGQFSYISCYGGFPVYRNTGFDYYPMGEKGFPVMLEEMKKAKNFIFLEYFIIEEGKMWNAMLAILREKAQEGVDCRVLYDDMGSMSTLPFRYTRELEKVGIQAQAFNHVSPIINGIMNHRDHRKIMVIDGKVAFSGGINLADEYINEKKLHGVWKDTCIRVTGEAVYSFTCLFLTNWNALRPGDQDYTRYKAEPVPGKADGYIAPYGETPLDDRLLGEGIYINIINQARKYCYIFTPYLIIDEDMMNALILAASRGVDVRIITPGIPDKKLIWNITRSYYPNLIKGGVKIYEYTPGFDHAKVFVADDEVAAVGTLNLDYRSLYLHFENGTFLCGSSKIPAIRDDFLSAVAVSRDMTTSRPKRGFHPLRILLFQTIRIFAPMM